MPKKQVTTKDQIAQRAFEIWQREGQPHGRDQEHWAQAEAELRETGAQKRATKAKSVAKVSAKPVAKAKSAIGEGGTKPLKAAKVKLNGAGAQVGA